MNHKPSTSLASFSAWALVALGLAHIGFGVVKFQAPLLQAASSGFVGMFSTPEVTRTAFWFVLFGLPLVLAGHVAVRAAEIGDLVLLRIIGGYVFLASLLGVAAFPASPFWASLVVSALLVAAGLGVKRARDVQPFGRGEAQRQDARPGLVVRVHFHQPGPGVLPSVPPHLKR